jgi:bifunctional UDP-N-acetylglucosamine pyrophosphorylase / glucosamine-1-phosphate N-acetyltransferase
MPEKQSSKATPIVSALILAAGKGTRMKSARPKVLHEVMGRPMLEWVIGAVKLAGASDITVVLAPEIKLFSAFFEAHPQMRVAVQNRQMGTGDAVAAAAAAYSVATPVAWSSGSLEVGIPSAANWILICAGDTPSINPNSIKKFMDAVIASKHSLGVLGMNVSEPTGYGRIVKDAHGQLARIVEERDADVATKGIKLCNSGVIFGRVDLIFEVLQSISPSNAQNEYYLTDIFVAAASRGEKAHVYETDAAEEFAGVNDRQQLSMIERSMISRRLKTLMDEGVTIHLPDTIFIGADVSVEADCEIFPGAFLKGKTRISRNCTIGPQVVLEDVVLGAGVEVGAHAVMIRSRVTGYQNILPQAVIIDSEL